MLLGDTESIPQPGIDLPRVVSAHSQEHLRENLRSCLARNLPEIRPLSAHSGTLSIAGGGPSLRETFGKLSGCVATVNGSHDYLLSRGVKPAVCALLDSNPRIAEMVTPRRGIKYFVGSTCDPAVFDRLNGYDVNVLHATGLLEDLPDIVKAERPNAVLVGGGSTVSLRWIVLGQILGFRIFHLHGMDSSFAKGWRHAYRQDDGARPETIEFEGYETSPQMLLQVADFFATVERLSKPDMPATVMKMFGRGLLQSQWKKYLKESQHGLAK